MDLSGAYHLPAAPLGVWQALNDAGLLHRCLDGCEALERLSDTTFSVRLKVRAGPVQAVFTGTLDMVDPNPPFSYTLAGQGKGGAAGFVKGTARIMLSEAEAGTTTVRYQAQVTVGGRLAALGNRLVGNAADQMVQTFFRRLATALETERKRN
ncbi:MAG: coxG [Rhodospirillaceae bacterium]|nr:MAG: coxG [Rhodospirillaceae bacterium]